MLESRPIDFMTDSIGRYGYTVQEIVMEQSPFDRIVFEADRERMSATFREAIRDRRNSLVMDYRIVDREGRARWVEDRTTFYYDERDDAHLYQSFLMDITERKLTEGRMALLHEMSMAFMEELDADALIKKILVKAAAFVGASDGLISVLEDNGEYRRNMYGVGLYEPLVGMRIPLDKGFQGEVMRTNRRIIVDDYRNYPERMNLVEYRDITTVIGIPLHRGDRLLGAISITFRGGVKANSLAEEQLNLLDQFAAAASIALLAIPHLGEAHFEPSNRSFIGEIERGDATPSLLTVEKLAVALGVGLAGLMARCEPELVD